MRKMIGLLTLLWATAALGQPQILITEAAAQTQVPISGLPPATALTVTELFPLVQSSTTVQTSVNSLIPFLQIKGLPGLSTTVTFASPFSGPPSFGLNLPSATNPFVIVGASTTAATDNAGGVLFVNKNTNYSTPAVGPGTGPAIYGLNIVGQGVEGNQQGVLGVIYNNNTMASQPAGTASAVGIFGQGVCNVASCAATWGGLTAAYDTTAQSAGPHPLIGLEVDNYSNDFTSVGGHVVLQLAGGRPVAGVGHANFVNYIILAGSPAADSTYGSVLTFNGTAQKGIDFSGGTFSGNVWASTGVTIDQSGNIAPNSVALANGSQVIWNANANDTIVNTAGVLYLNSSTSSAVIRGASSAVMATFGIKTANLTPGITFANLPTCNGAAAGNRAFVTDNNTAAAYRGAVSGSGTNQTAVICVNSTWVQD